jgi:hypothetical protein
MGFVYNQTTDQPPSTGSFKYGQKEEDAAYIACTNQSDSQASTITIMYVYDSTRGRDCKTQCNQL